MYKLLLCWRYLLTRYLALACIISVMLGVATLIVVNSVMGGFSTKLKERLHGLLSDVLVESQVMEGFPAPDAMMKQIRESPVGDQVEAMTKTVEVFAMLQYRSQDQWVTRPIRLIGVDPQTRARVGGFAEHLVRQHGSPNPSFQLDEEGRKRFEAHQRLQPPKIHLPADATGPDGLPPPAEWLPDSVKVPEGIILGYALTHFKYRATPDADVGEVAVLSPGDDVVITTVSGQKLAPVSDRFVVCDYFKSEMSEYDSNYAFVPLEYLQQIRTMEDRVTSIQIKLKDYQKAKEVVGTLQEMFPTTADFHVATWEDKQGPLLAAIGVERGLLNVLLFLIICVAGFGILAIFAMIVVEKTRDIGILKALGASNGGVMSIFLGYGLLLGLVGAGFGDALGVTFTVYINQIEKFLGKVTGQDIFPRDVYYFDKIPTDLESWNIFMINLGAVGIAVLFSILPALRAALLHPVRALRYE